VCVQDLVDEEQLVETGALSQRLVCVEAASHWLLKSRCASVQIQLVSSMRSPALDSTHNTPSPTKRRALESELQEDPVSTATAVNQPVSMEIDAEEAVHKVDGGSEQHMSDGKGAELNTDPASSQMKGVCLELF